MGIFIVTGGSSGIGLETIRLLKEQGHETVNISIADADIIADLSDSDARQRVIDQLYEMYPEGIDGLCCNAGVSGACGDLRLIVGLNYFGATEMASGLFELLKRKKGNCVVTSSNTISGGAARMDLVNLLNNNHERYESEVRILKMVSEWDQKDLSVGNSVYVASKYALARWVRRVSATWAANGVRINAVAPGNVATPMTEALTGPARMALAALPIPTCYGTDKLMDPVDIANGIVFLVSPMAHGFNGNVIFIDGGTDALLNSEKVY